MYDAIDDPYTYENSTVLVNKLDLRDQDDLDAYEAEISNARSGGDLAALDPQIMLDAMIEGDEKKLVRAIRELIAK